MRWQCCCQGWCLSTTVSMPTCLVFSTYQSRQVRDDVGIVVNNGGGKVFILFTMTVAWGVVKGGKTMNQDGV